MSGEEEQEGHMRAMFFIEGKFRLTNQMISDLRAAGHYEGEARARRLRKKPGYDLFAAETQAIRLAVKGAARVAGIGQASGVQNVVVWVFGHRRHDPDAWLLLAKAAVDGLVDARVMVSDRFNVGMLAGRVLQSEAEEFEVRLECRERTGEAVPENRPGMVVALYESKGLPGVCRG